MVITVAADAVAFNSAGPSAATVLATSVLSARLQYLQCSCTGDTAVLHEAFDIYTCGRVNDSSGSTSHWKMQALLVVT